MDNFTASLPLMLKQLKLSTMLQQWNTLGKSDGRTMEPAAILV